MATLGHGEDRTYWVNIVTNGRYGVLYVGVTNSLQRREWKVRLIERDNPYWADLCPEMMAPPPMHPDIRAAMAAACG